MADVNEEYVERCLKDLLGWADYISASLALDHPHERGKIRLLETLASKEHLETVRSDARALRYRLENLVANLRRPVDTVR